MDGEALWNELCGTAPRLTSEVEAIVEAATGSARSDLIRGKARVSDFPKILNDPIWGTIELKPWEVVLLDTPLVQRLRGIRQLGMAYLVYPSASHDRLQHSCGVVEAAQRIVDSLAHNAKNRTTFGGEPDPSVPQPSSLDVVAIRLGALLHDVGHSPFSHATEPVVRKRFEDEFERVEDLLRSKFEGVTSIQTSETIAIAIVLSKAMRGILENPQFEACTEKSTLAPAIVARLLGSRSCLAATYLSGVISGPLDADKIDYMARDSHQAGLPLGLDITRLISKLEVVTVTPDNAPNPDLKRRAEAAKRKRLHDVGISRAGLGAYEQMMISRVILYDRLYYHHKVRAAEAMVRELIHIAEEERTESYPLSAFYELITDEEALSCIAGNTIRRSVPPGGPRAMALGTALRQRSIYHRAFAFSARFIAGLDGLPSRSADDTRALRWGNVLRALGDSETRRNLASAIHAKAMTIASAEQRFSSVAGSLLAEHIIVDLPSDKLVVRGGDILTRTESGEIGTPNLFFDPEKWSEAYTHQKQCGYVFCTEDAVELVALASTVVFHERFSLAMGAEAHRLAKTSKYDFKTSIQKLAERGVCSAECAELLTSAKPQLALLEASQLTFPEEILNNDPGFPARLADQFNEALPGGIPATVHKATVATLQALVSVVAVLETGGKFVNQTLKEKQLQELLRDGLRMRGVSVTEGAEVGGGETDLVLYDTIVVENKVSKSAAEPHNDVYDLQAGRYRMAISSSVGVVIVGHPTKDEDDITPLARRLQVRPSVRESENAAVIWLTIPFGRALPSQVRKP